MNKSEIEEMLQQQNTEQARKYLEKYEVECPEDLEITAMWTDYYLQIGDLQNARLWAEKGVRRCPLNGDLLYNLAYVYELLGDAVFALYYYHRAEVVYYYAKNPNQAEVQERERDISERLAELDYASMEEAERAEMLQRIETLQKMLDKDCGLYDRVFRSFEQVVGQYYYVDMMSKRYVGIFKDVGLTYPPQNDKDNQDLLHIKGEFLDVTEGKVMQIDLPNESESDVFIPIASASEDNVLRFVQGEDTIDTIQYQPCRFQYYRTKNHTTIQSSGDCYYGKPILLKNDPNKKRLILSIFVDGLSNEILNGDGFQQCMPYTYEFFRKGTIFTRAYSTAEWTYPSIAAITSGLDTTHHMLIHNELDVALPYDATVIGEYFQNEGYYTAMLGGNWRIIPTYGYARGIDRYVYQNATTGYKVHEAIADAIDHIEAFGDVNQYIWLSIGDLHDVDDGFVLPVDVQKNLTVAERKLEDKGVTSVKQKYSANKTAQYRRQASHIDHWLHILYNYIEEHYKDEEIIVSIFSDHGQGFLVPDQEPFFSKGRANVGFMFRGGAADGKGVTDELVSTLDYTTIMRYLSGIPIGDEEIDGRLPKIYGASDEREYVISESIHPGDTYQATIYAQDGTFFFKNPEEVQIDGRFELKDCEYYYESKNGQKERDGEHVEYYLDIMRRHISPLLIYR